MVKPKSAYPPVIQFEIGINNYGGKLQILNV